MSGYLDEYGDGSTRWVDTTADHPAAGTDQAGEARLLAAYEASKASDDGRSLPSPDRFLLRVLRERDEAQAEAATLRRDLVAAIILSDTLRADLDAAQAKVERVEALRDRLRGADHHSGLNYHHGTRYADWMSSALDGPPAGTDAGHESGGDRG